MIAKMVSIDRAATFVQSNQTLMVGGFGLIGQPVHLLEAVAKRASASNLTVISNNLGEPGRGLGVLLEQNMISRAVGSFFTSNPRAVEEYRANRLDIELLPQGTLAEAIRSGGCGIPAFFTPTGVGTELAANYESRFFGDREYLLVPALTADVSLIRARTSDIYGNLTYSKTGQNFNSAMASAGRLVIAEVDNIVDFHSSRDEIVTPHLYVDYIFCRGDAR